MQGIGASILSTLIVVVVIIFGILASLIISKILSKVQNTIEREIYIEKIAKGYNISKEAIYAEVNKLIYSKSKEDKVLESKEIRKIKKPILEPELEQWMMEHDLEPVIKALTGVR